MTPRKKPVFDNGLPIGEAASWEEARTVLITSGYTEFAAGTACSTRGVEGPDGFHIVALAGEVKMCADVRAIKRRAAMPTSTGARS
jgi:hypothetical protein